MTNQLLLTEKKFQEMENGILDQVMETSKSLIETFKFSLIYGSKVSHELNKKTLVSLKKFRKENWDSKSDKETACDVLPALKRGFQ